MNIYEGMYLLFVRVEKHGLQITYPDTFMLGRYSTKKKVIDELQQRRKMEQYKKGAQFYVEHENFIVAIQVWGELLWLDKVPKPSYFNGPPKPKGCGLRIPAAVMRGISGLTNTKNVVDFKHESSATSLIELPFPG